MAVCVLNVSGLNFRVDEFLKSSRLKVASIYRKGEVPGSKNPNKIPRPDSGFVVLISNEENETTAETIERAAQFLNEFSDELKRCRDYGVDDVRIDFAHVRGRDVQESQYLPPEFLVLVGSLGIGLEATSIAIPTG